MSHRLDRLWQWLRGKAHQSPTEAHRGHVVEVGDAGVTRPLSAPASTLVQLSDINERLTALDQRLRRRHEEAMRIRAEVYGGKSE
jgi:hypothetical protein